MSISSTTAVARFTITALPQTLAIFAFRQQSDLVVSDGAKILVLNSDYTVSGGGYNSQNQLQTGSVVILNPGTGTVQPGDIVTVYRGISLVQQTTFASTGIQTPLMIEADDDLLTQIAQQLAFSSYLPFPPVSGTPNAIFLGWITADVGGITTSIDSLNVVNIPAVALPLIISVSISDDYEGWKLRPMQIGDPNASLAGAYIVPVTNPNSLIWVRVF